MTTDQIKAKIEELKQQEQQQMAQFNQLTAQREQAQANINFTRGAYVALEEAIKEEEPEKAAEASA